MGYSLPESLLCIEEKSKMLSLMEGIILIKKTFCFPPLDATIGTTEATIGVCFINEYFGGNADIRIIAGGP